MKKNTNGLISVIVPVYNVEKYLANCLDSIINQTYKNLEILLIDDGSTDNSGKICDDYAKKDNRIKVIHKENGGLSSARNIGINNANGNYLSFIDSDDTINHEMMNNMLDSINKNNTDMAICKLNIIKDEVKTNEKIDINEKIEVITPNDVYDMLYNHKQAEMTSSCNKIFKIELFDDIRYPLGEINEDDAILHLILDKVNIISYSNIPYYNYYQRTGSIMHKRNPKAKQSVEHYIVRGNYFFDKKMYKYYDMNAFLICFVLALHYKDLDKSYYKKNKKKYSKIVLESKYCNFEQKIVTFLIRIHPRILNILLFIKR